MSTSSAVRLATPAGPLIDDGQIQPRDTPSPTVGHPLRAGLLPRLRADGTIQLGLDPVHGVVITGLADHERERMCRVLQILAGASAPITADALAAATGLPASRVGEVLHALYDAGLTHDPWVGEVVDDMSAWSLPRRRHGAEQSLRWRPPLRVRERRAGARVVIDGRGSMVVEIARALRAAHVGDVHCGWYAGAAGDLVGEGPDPSLVITVGARPPGVRAMDWWDRSIAHLPVLARPGSVDIGPLVVPGSGPCPACLRLHERDSPWADGGRGDLVADGQDDVVRVEPSLAGMATGAVSMLALGLLDAYPPPVGVRWHTALPLPSLATSRWQVHPRCDTPSHRRRAPCASGDAGSGKQDGRIEM